MLTRFALILAAFVFLPGCQSRQSGAGAPDQPIADIASGEQPNDTLHVVGHGAGEKLTFKATQPGTIYLYDFDTGQKIFSERLEAKQTFTFDPQASRATIDNQTVTLDHITNGRDEYRLYFDRQAK